MKNNILDYEQVEEMMKQITKEGKIQESEILGETEHGLPIRNYTIGEGEYEIVITGATHASEIITTDFIIRLMKEINQNTSKWKLVLKNFKINFIPILNPEGYLIATSAVRKLIPRNMSQEEAEKICKKYYIEYKKDDTKETAIKDVKRHQIMFQEADYTCIPEKYIEIREAVKNILDKYPDIPKGCLQIWSANGNGIDIQANSEYNPAIDKIMQGETIHMGSLRHNNIDISHPGPINCPFDRQIGFKMEKETLAISNLLERLNKKGKLFAYLNYHSTGGLVFQRPAMPPEGFDISEDEIAKKEIINYMFAKLYADKTYKNTGIDQDGNDKKEQSRYIIKVQNYPITTSNDVFRVKYPQNLLIELSGMGGNPIGPYGDIKGNYTNAIKSNLDAIKSTLELSSIAQMISTASYETIRKLEGNQDYNKVIEIEDIIYQEFIKRVQQLEKNKEKEKRANDEWNR